MKRLALIIALSAAGGAVAQTVGTTLFKQARISDGASVMITRTPDAAGGVFFSTVSFSPEWDPAKVTGLTDRPAQRVCTTPISAPPNVACRTWLKEAYVTPIRACGFDTEP